MYSHNDKELIKLNTKVLNQLRELSLSDNYLCASNRNRSKPKNDESTENYLPPASDTPDSESSRLSITSHSHNGQV